MLDNDEVSIFLEKVAVFWEFWVGEYDPGYNLNHENRSFINWFFDIGPEMQNDFVEYINGL